MGWHRCTLLPVGLLLAGCAADPATVVPAGPLPLARAQQAELEPRPALPVAAGKPADTRVAVRVCAIVNGVPILDDEVREASYYKLLATQSLPEPERSRRQQEIYLEERQKIIDREVVLSEALAKLKKLRPHVIEKLQEAARKEFDKTVRNMKMQAANQGFPIQSDEELIALLKSQGMSYDGVRRQIERSFMMMEYMRSRIFPVIERMGYEDVLEYYHEHPGEFQREDKVVWQDLFIDVYSFPDRDAARACAEQYLARARKGEDFLSLVKDYNARYNSFNNGDGYGQRRGEIRPPEAEAVLFSLKDGQVGPLIEMASGFHVVRLVQREYAGLQPLDEKTQAEIRKKVQNAIGEREYKRILNELKKTASIQIFDP